MTYTIEDAKRELEAVLRRCKRCGCGTGGEVDHDLEFWVHKALEKMDGDYLVLQTYYACTCVVYGDKRAEVEKIFGEWSALVAVSRYASLEAFDYDITPADTIKRLVEWHECEQYVPVDEIIEDARTAFERALNEYVEVRKRYLPVQHRQIDQAEIFEMAEKILRVMYGDSIAKTTQA